MGRVAAGVVGVCLVIAVAGCDPDESPPAGVLRVFGTTGMGPGEFSYPRAAALDAAAGRLFVVDKAARVQCFNLQGEYQYEWRMPVWKAGKPTGLGLGPRGRVYVADTHYARVVVYEPDGEAVGWFGRMGEGPGEFVLPTDVAVTPTGELYVSEYGGNDRISKFDADWNYLFSFGGPDSGEARLQRPQCLRLAPDGTLWVADACNHRICHFAADGTLLGWFGHSGPEVGALWFPYGLELLGDGTLVVCEYGNNRVQRFTTDGQSLGTWGRAGRDEGELAYPWALAVTGDDEICVVDSGNNRVQVFAGDVTENWWRPAATE
jgi:DNA-binding beta-propeller fold protein YncE